MIKSLKGGVIQLNFLCRNPDVKSRPVFLDVYWGKEKIDHIIFTQAGWLKRQYDNGIYYRATPQNESEEPTAYKNL